MDKQYASGLFAQGRAGIAIATMFLVILSPIQSSAENFVTNGSANVGGQSNQFVARGLIRSNTKTEIRTELKAPVAQAPFKAGQEFAEGDILIAFDCERYEAELNAAKAGANAAWIEYKSKKRLLAHQAIGKDEVRLAAANANRASAETEIRKVINSDCEIKAPFSGRVVEANTGAGEYPTSEKPLMVILDDGNLEIEILVPSNWLVWLKQNQKLTFAIDETGNSIQGQISRLGAEIDPVSKTIKVYASLEPDSDFILAGMSGQAFFSGGS